uniref:C-type lectin domain-containing protein n=1 Tax=Steinernema glaseri TaxID=37863 RepID=A0A1I7ZY99_9BILA
MSTASVQFGSQRIGPGVRFLQRRPHYMSVSSIYICFTRKLLMKCFIFFFLFCPSLCDIYLLPLPKGTIIYGKVGDVVTGKEDPRDCVRQWDGSNSLPKTFVFKSGTKSCTALTSVFGTRKGSSEEEAFIVQESMENLCPTNVTEALQKILVTCREGWKRLELASAVNCYQMMTDFKSPYSDGWYGFKIGLHYPSFEWVDGTPYDYGPDPTATVNKAANKQYCRTASAGRCYYGALFWKGNTIDYSGGDVNNRPFMCKYVASA